MWPTRRPAAAVLAGARPASELDAVVRRAMAKDPADRYPSAGDLGGRACGRRRQAPGDRRAVVATGDALPRPSGRPALGIGSRTGPNAGMWRGPRGGPGGVLRWVLPIGVLVASWRRGWLLCWRLSRSSERFCLGVVVRRFRDL